MAQRVELVVGAIQVAGKTEHLAQEETAARIGRVVPHLLERGCDGFVQLAGTKQVAGTHGRQSSRLGIRDRLDPVRGDRSAPIRAVQSGRPADSSVLSRMLINI